eukprot:tig00000852_g5045.t1
MWRLSVQWDLDHCVRFGVRLLEAAGEASRTAWYLRALTSVAEKIWPHHQTLWNPREGLALEIALRESGVGALDSAYELLGRKARQLLSNPLVSGYAALLALLIVRHELQQVPGGDAPRLSSEWRGSLGVRRISKKAADVLKEGVQFSARALELRPDSSFFVFIRAQLLFLAEGMGAPCMSGPSCVHVEDADALVEFHATEVEKWIANKAESSRTEPSSGRVDQQGKRDREWSPGQLALLAVVAAVLSIAVAFSLSSN